VLGAVDLGKVYRVIASGGGGQYLARLCGGGERQSRTASTSPLPGVNFVGATPHQRLGIQPKRRFRAWARNFNNIPVSRCFSALVDAGGLHPVTLTYGQRDYTGQAKAPPTMRQGCAP
jgi:hypothetical protein